MKFLAITLLLILAFAAQIPSAHAEKESAADGCLYLGGMTAAGLVAFDVIRLKPINKLQVAAGAGAGCVTGAVMDTAKAEEAPTERELYQDETATQNSEE